MPNISSIDEIKDLSIEDFKLEGYEHHPPIKAKMAI
jgi:thymidylate synthase